MSTPSIQHAAFGGVSRPSDVNSFASLRRASASLDWLQSSSVTKDRRCGSAAIFRTRLYRIGGDCFPRPVARASTWEGGARADSD